MSPFHLTRTLPDGATDTALRADVLQGLTSTPKTLPPKWFYDAHGSRLFEQITTLPEYYPTRAERDILITRAAEIAAATGARTLVELGSGSCEKTRHLLDALPALHTYVPVDVSESMLCEAGHALTDDRADLSVHALVADFTDRLVLPPTPGPRLVAFLGGTIGNLLPAERAAFLASMRALLTPDDALLLGTDLVKDPAVLVPAYDDSAGVTAAFNKNVLSVINRELGADFDPDTFAHVALWDPCNEWIEMRLRSLRAQTVKIPALDLLVDFADGEELRTEVSAKFREPQVRSELAAAGLTVSHWWTDPDQLYSLALATVPPPPRRRLGDGGAAATAPRHQQHRTRSPQRHAGPGALQHDFPGARPYHARPHPSPAIKDTGPAADAARAEASPSPTGHTAPAPGPVLILGAGTREYREFLLQHIAAARPVVLADLAAPSWALPYMDQFLPIDFQDRDGVCAAVKEFAATRPVAAVLTYMEHHVELAAQLAQHLALPGSPPASMAACRDKATSRRLFAEHAVPSPRSALVDTAEQAAACAQQIGYPVVVKPRAMAGGAGVTRADSAADVYRAYPRAGRASVLGLEAFAVSGVLVEEYLPGPEISAECAVLADGDVRILAVTRKQLGPEPAFQETGHTVDAHDALLTDPALAAVVTCAVQALGITLGVLHVEVRLTPRGPVVIEVNGRLAGDLIPRLVQLATGLDLPLVAATLAAAGVPDLRPTTAQAAAIAFAYPDHTGRIDQLALSSPDKPWLERFVWTRKPGNRVSAHPDSSIDDRLAHWIVTGSDAAQCDARRRSMAGRLTVRLSRHAPHTTACVR